MLLIGFLLFGVLHYRIAGAIVLVMGTIVLISGLFVPSIFWAIERVGAILGLAVGTALTWLLLVPFFYLCFTTVRLFHLMKGKDPLCRRCPTDEPTYWVPRPPVTDPAHYRKQQ